MLNLAANPDMVIVIGNRLNNIHAMRVPQAMGMKALDHDMQILEGNEETELDVHGLVIMNEQYTTLDKITHC